MATATTVKNSISQVTLTLSREEALAVWHLTRALRESPNACFSNQTVKSVLNGVRDALSAAFREEISPEMMMSFEVIGGNPRARTKSLDNLDPAK